MVLMLGNNLGPSPVLLSKVCAQHKCARALGQGPRKSVPRLNLYSVEKVGPADQCGGTVCQKSGAAACKPCSGSPGPVGCWQLRATCLAGGV